MSKIKYPIGIQSFSEIRNKGYIYVDKTKLIYELVEYGKYYFLSRPRRFGKSLLISTLEALFKGKRELFKDLAIDSLDWEWQEYPILHFDLNGKVYDKAEHLDNILHEHLSLWEKAYGCPGEGKDPDERFRTVIRTIFEKTGRQVVILIDEYDQPLLKSLENHKLNENFRKKLQSFFSVIKTMDPHIRFAMLTGVSKFSKVSIFSGLNNLNDISLEPKYNSICGISESELHAYFSQSIEEMAQEHGVSPEEIGQELKKNYDGYHFAKRGEDIYNPFSLLNTFIKQEFSDYWFATGSPDSLVSLLERSNFLIPNLEDYNCSESVLTGSDIYLTDPVPLFYQSGYLTIKGYESEFNQYILGFPNVEVSKGFVNYLMKSITKDTADISSMVSKFVSDVREGNADDFMKKLQSFTAGIPYDIIPENNLNKEVYFQNLMFAIMKLMGFYTHAEYRTSNGRIDMIVETSKYLYIMEFKIDSTPEIALKQIDDKQYALPFKTLGKTIFKIGANFSTATRRLESWLIVKE